MTTMNELPPPGAGSTSDGGPAPVSADGARRLEALAQRRRTPVEAAATARTDDERRGEERLAALRSRRATPPPGEPASTPRRRHPAHGARRAALGLSLASTGGLAAFFGSSGSTAGAELTSAHVVQVASSTTSTASTGTPMAAGPAAAGAGTATTATVITPAADTVVDGATYHNKWGNVQVQATFDSTGSLVDVTALQTPTGGKSNRINEYAVPRLTSEALTTQSAQVDTVSGATYTSVDYRHSLQSAIDAARAAGATRLV